MLDTIFEVHICFLSLPLVLILLFFSSETFTFCVLELALHLTLTSFLKGTLAFEYEYIAHSGFSL